MNLQVCSLNLDHTRKELTPHGTNGFPCAAYQDSYKNIEPDTLPWHWHEELEITHVVSGQMILQLPKKTIRLCTGDTAVINSGILHAAHGDPLCQVQAFVFHPAFITGSTHSIFAEKYLTPLTTCTAFQVLPINQYSSLFKEAFQTLESKSPGFEFIIREKLSAICMQLFLHYQKKIEIPPENPGQDSIRIRTMVDFIQENYMNPIEISSIAQSANIGQRECLRCFQRTIHTSPGQYLLRYRITQGASMLLQNPCQSIAQVSLSCGFESPSNFSQYFKRYFKCTPREYRQAHTQLHGSRSASASSFQ